ncbi:MAG TPA: hypothetical protein PKZ32_13120 [Candidatus Melainabacteria bacterium]|nr:hypothetical protein [Candidatus Melainabacteria bacterium]
MRKTARKTGTLLGIAILAGMILSTSTAQPAQAQIADILKNALAGQLNGSNVNDPNLNYGDYSDSQSNGISGLLNQLLPGQTANSLPLNQDYQYAAPSTGNSLMDSLLPLVQNSGVGSSLLGSYLPQPQLSSAYGSNYPTNLSGGYLNGLPGFQKFAGVQPVVFNGVTLDSGIYSGPYRGTPHQVESAMNLDWQMTVLKEQIGLGAAQGYLMPSDANSFLAELDGLISQKHRVVRRNGLSFADSEVLVRRLNDLVGRVRQSWYDQTAFSRRGNGGGWGRHGRFARANAYGQVLSPSRNDTLERLYLMTQPAGGGFRY